MNQRLYRLIIPGTPRRKEARSSRWYKRIIKEIAEIEFPRPLDSNDLIVEIYYVYRTVPGIDIDNMAKPILDALKGIAYKDDRQIRHLLLHQNSLSSFKGIPEWAVKYTDILGKFVAIEVREEL